MVSVTSMVTYGVSRRIMWGRDSLPAGVMDAKTYEFMGMD